MTNTSRCHMWEIQRIPDECLSRHLALSDLTSCEVTKVAKKKRRRQKRRSPMFTQAEELDADHRLCVSGRFFLVEGSALDGLDKLRRGLFLKVAEIWASILRDALEPNNVLDIFNVEHSKSNIRKFKCSKEKTNKYSRGRKIGSLYGPLFRECKLPFSY